MPRVPTEQRPIASPFDAHSTAEQVIAGTDLSGRTALVTGGYSGLGREMTRVLSQAGARVIVPVRSPEKARSALDGIPNVTVEAVDLADAASVDALAERILATGEPLNILIHSAGIMASPLARTAEGHEMQLAVNHLAPYRLTGRLAPALAAGEARVVSLSSRAHRLSAIDFNDPNFARKAYDPWIAYGQSKSANALFALELDRLPRRARRQAREWNLDHRGWRPERLRIKFGSPCGCPGRISGAHQAGVTSVRV
jgi:NAD(P)-dependent dehydrogenase (short-subunit alcohol dehydrogenase family)